MGLSSYGDSTAIKKKEKKFQYLNNPDIILPKVQICSIYSVFLNVL